MAKGQFDKFQKKIDRYTTSVLNGQLTGAEEVVKLYSLEGHLGQVDIQIHGKLE